MTEDKKGNQEVEISKRTGGKRIGDPGGAKQKGHRL